MDTRALQTDVDGVWDDSIVPALVEDIRIPAKSPFFDADWKAHGHIAKAVAQVEAWCKAQPIEELTVEVIELEGRTPLIYMEVPATQPELSDDTVVLYGHIDKQPEMTGWRDDLGPWKPVIEDGKLYGRGGADDGYAAFASLTAVAAMHRHGLPHARLVILIEASEESGSPDLPHYIDALSDRIGKVSLVVCLDSGCGNYDQLWCTTSLRGLAAGTLRVEVLREGVHSGDASGIVPSSFRVARQLLSRIEDEATGVVTLPALNGPIPEARKTQARAAAEVLKDEVFSKFPWAEGMSPVSKDLPELVLNRTWRPALSVTGVDGVPPLGNAGNVLRPHTSLKLSFRLPPNVDGATALAGIKEALEKDPPYGAKISFEGEHATGWDAPPLAPWLETAIDEASKRFFDRPAAYMGEGGTIPFMGMLGEKFPEAQFLITGVLGPESNAHGPNEFLHIHTGKRLTAAVASVLEAHTKR